MQPAEVRVAGGLPLVTDAATENGIKAAANQPLKMFSTEQALEHHKDAILRAIRRKKDPKGADTLFIEDLFLRLSSKDYAKYWVSLRGHELVRSSKFMEIYISGYAYRGELCERVKGPVMPEQGSD